MGRAVPRGLLATPARARRASLPTQPRRRAPSRPPRRCFEFYLNFQGCMADNVDRSKCADFMDDFYECMHHKKELQRWRAIETEWEKKAAQGKVPTREEWIKQRVAKHEYTNERTSSLF